MTGLLKASHGYRLLVAYLDVGAYVYNVLLSENQNKSMFWCGWWATRYSTNRIC